MYNILKPLLFQLDAERAHELTLRLLRLAQGFRLAPRFRSENTPPAQVMGLSFPTRLGLAAGMDKNADFLDPLAALGFGFIEVGTVTPRPQPGNPRPRLFRIPEKQALINRMGFNNKGLAYLESRIRRKPEGLVLGVNIGKNADTPIDRALDDYVLCLRGVYAYADYVVANISSPNTKGLRDLQAADALAPLLQGIKNAQLDLKEQHARFVPIAVKIAPDLAAGEIRQICSKVVELGFDAIVATNTTLARPGLDALSIAEEPGGLSGAPLAPLASSVLRTVRDAVGPDFPVIAAGGIMSGTDAAERRRSGADLLQIYTGLVYRGPGLIPEIIEALDQAEGR